MTYALICLPFLVVGIAIAMFATRRMPACERRRRRLAMAIAGVVLLVLTAVFDSLMIAAELFEYADGTRLGPSIGNAPIEDFAYPTVALLVVPSVWTIGRRRTRERTHCED